MKVVALAIGVDHYAHPENFSTLNCAVNDANAVAETLNELKVDVVTSLDDNDDEVFLYYEDFLRRISEESPQVAVFYFAGHGERINLQECLILKNAYRSHLAETVILKHSLQVNTIMQDMRQKGDQINILILDACRVEGRGLLAHQNANLKVPFQTFIAYSTTAGKTASDGKMGGHSPFTRALLNHLKTENLKVEDLFKQVRKDMFDAGHQQYSWDYSCLVDDFCFNHGQLNRHYGSTYCFLAFSPTIVALSDARKSSFIIDIKSENERKIESAMSMLIAHKNDFKLEDLFIMGRYMLHACNRAFAAKYITITKLALLKVGNRNPFFDGILYEMFFDKEDNCRNKNIAGVGILDDVAKVCDSPDFASSLVFIQKELEPFKEQVSFIPGNEIHSVRLMLEKSDVSEFSDKKVWIIVNVEYYGNDIHDDLEQTAYTYQNLRSEIRNVLRIPFRNLNIKASEQVEPHDVLMLGELGYVDSFIDDYYLTHNPSDFDELGHHYEYCGVEDSVVLNVDEANGLLVVSGTFAVSIIAYLDDEEEINNDVTLDGEFKMTLEYSGNSWSVVDYDEMRLETPSYLYE